MKTTDLFKINRSSRRLNESMERIFGKKINLESFDLPRLEDARNKLRTQLSQIRGESSFNENLENEAFSQAQFMLDAINAEIAQRQEFIADAGTAEVSEGSSDFVFNAIEDLRSYKPGLDKENFLDELYSYIDAEYGKMAADRAFAVGEEAYDEWYDSYTDATDEQMAINPNETNESVKTGDNMTKLNEGEIQQAQSIVSAKTMVDRVGRWIEELSGMENDTLLQLGDQIRDEMSAELAKQYISSVAPAIQQALEGLKSTRETLASGVRMLTGEEQGAEMLGADGAGDEMGGDELGDIGGEAEPDMMNMGDEEMGPPEDEFGASDAAAGGLGDAGRAKRESIDYGNKLLKVLAG